MLEMEEKKPEIREYLACYIIAWGVIQTVLCYESCVKIGEAIDALLIMTICQ